MKENFTKVRLTASQELKILRRIVDITSSELELQYVLRDVVTIMNEVTGADSVFIYLVDDKKKNLILQASKTPHKKELGNIMLKIGEGITGWVAQEGKPVSIKEKAYQDARFRAFDVLPEDHYEAFLAVPIVYKNKVIGVINLQYKLPHKNAPRVDSLIASIAQQVGGVIETARLYNETKNKAVQFESLVKISETITSEKYLDEILDLVVVITAEMLNSKICSIMLLDEKKETLMMKATQCLSKAYTTKPHLKVATSLSGEVVRSKVSRAVFDVTKEKQYMFRDMARQENLNSMLLVPMVVKDEAIGVLNVYTKEPHEFTKEEIDALQIVANQAAVAIENTRLMEEALKVRDALETRKLTERAKGILMESQNVNEATAYKIMRKKSMDLCRSMKEIAEAIILTSDMTI